MTADRNGIRTQIPNGTLPVMNNKIFIEGAKIRKFGSSRQCLLAYLLYIAYIGFYGPTCLIQWIFYNMNFKELALQRQSVRKYLDKPVEKEKLEQCIETARVSPSAHNSQPWKFIVIDDPQLRTQVGERAVGMGMNKFAPSAPVIIAMVLEKMGTLTSIASVIKDKEFSLLDLGMAANQLCLQAADLGLGTCIIGWFDEKKVKRLLGVDKKKRVPLIITLGYTDAPTRPKIRKSVESICSWNKY